MPTESWYEYAGTVSQNLGTIPRWTAFSTLKWTYNGFEVDINDKYVPSVNDVGPGGAGATKAVSVSSFQQIDFEVAYSFAELNWSEYLNGLTIRAGVNDVFNKWAPVALHAETQTNADVGFYGAIGREYYVDLTYKF
jgi:iron complex outermembrane receptor protein